MTTHLSANSGGYLQFDHIQRDTGTGRLRASKGAPEVCGTGTVCREGTLWRRDMAEYRLMSSIIGYPGHAHIRLTGDSKPPLCECVSDHCPVMDQ